MMNNMYDFLVAGNELENSLELAVFLPKACAGLSC